MKKNLNFLLRLVITANYLTILLITHSLSLLSKSRALLNKKVGVTGRGGDLRENTSEVPDPAYLPLLLFLCFPLFILGHLSSALARLLAADDVKSLSECVIETPVNNETTVKRRRSLRL